VPEWFLVLLFAAGTAVATGLGALPFLFLRNLPRASLALATAAAAGAMLGAAFGLIHEGLAGDGEWRTIAGAGAGVVFILLTRRFIPSEHAGLHHLGKAGTRRALIVLGVMTIHSLAEGIGVGVAFGEGRDFGLMITIAIAIHNIPEGVAISAVMVPRGTPVWQAALWSVFSSLPQPLAAVPAFRFVEAFGWWLPVGLGFAAGAMVWMVISELLPDALEEGDGHWVGVVGSASLILMIAMQRALPG
jgi:zinc transporter ZupT